MANSLEDAIVEDGDMGEIPNSIPGMESGRLPTAEELLKLLDGMDGLSDEDKESLRADLTRNIENGGNPFGQAAAAAPSIFSYQTLILFAFLALIALIFGN